MQPTRHLGRHRGAGTSGAKRPTCCTRGVNIGEDLDVEYRLRPAEVFATDEQPKLKPVPDEVFEIPLNYRTWSSVAVRCRTTHTAVPPPSVAAIVVAE
jgi:hypothetical protein